MANPTKLECQFADRNGRPLIGLAQTLVADAVVNYTTGGLDTEAELIVAINANGVKINSILACLQAHGLMKDA